MGTDGLGSPGAWILVSGHGNDGEGAQGERIGTELFRGSLVRVRMRARHPALLAQDAAGAGEDNRDDEHANHE